MTPKVRKRAASVVVHPRVDDTSIPGNEASGSRVGADAKPGNETPRSQNPWPAEFGWDFPFDFPKQTR